MKNRPLSVTVISWIFIGAGALGFFYHLSGFKTLRPFQYDLVWVCLVRLIAILCGGFMLRGHNWARWLLLIWIAYHVILSALHSVFGTVVHGFLLAVISYFLFRSRVTAFFREPKT